jgi:hypothetical protein
MERNNAGENSPRHQKRENRLREGGGVEVCGKGSHYMYSEEFNRNVRQRLERGEEANENNELRREAIARLQESVLPPCPPQSHFPGHLSRPNPSYSYMNPEPTHSAAVPLDFGDSELPVASSILLQHERRKRDMERVRELVSSAIKRQGEVAASHDFINPGSEKETVSSDFSRSVLYQQQQRRHAVDLVSQRARRVDPLLANTQEVQLNSSLTQPSPIGHANALPYLSPGDALWIQNQMQHRRQQPLGSPPPFQPAVASQVAEFPLNPHPSFRREFELYTPGDDNILSEPQVLLRKQMEFFQAETVDIQVVTPIRRNEISVGQVGVRCKHCARGLKQHQYVKGTMYFPSTLRALYQAAQNCGKVHLSDICPKVSTEVKNQLKTYMETPASIGYGGKIYWSDCASARGICETEIGLRFR